MASMSGAHAMQVQADTVRATIAHAKQLTVERLKRVLKSEGLAVSGVKTELQQRLIAHIYDCDRKNDLERIQRIQNAVRGYYPATPATTTTAYNSNPNPYPSPYSNHTPAPSASPQNYYTSPAPRLPPPPSLAMPSNPGYGQARLTFKTSPFYTIQRQLGTTVELRSRETTRDTARLTINLDQGLAERFQHDSSCRAMVFCAQESFDAAWKPVDIAFPHHAELRCNQEDVKSNLKGLKNKPGSTRPVDITPFLRKRAGFPNSLELVYALTSKKYFLLVYQVLKRSIESLVDELRKGKYLSKDRVIREMQSRAENDDIVATSSNMSLRDPVQMTRIDTPCRSIGCKHNECFDAAVYLALQEQAPTWTCPICSKPATWDNLVFDQFVHDILLNTKRDVEQVSILPSGQWHLIKGDAPERDDHHDHLHRHHDPFASRLESYGGDDDDDDDLVEITDLDAPKTVASIRTRPSFSSICTPPINGSRENSFFMPQSSSAAASLAASSAHPASQSRKRPREENVIDLTLSDDDDQPPVSRIKRPPPTAHLSDSNRPGAFTAPYRFNLPPPVPSRTSTSSPANPYSPGIFSDYDPFTTRL